MGAWSEESTGNDSAQEWLANAIEYPITQAISEALDQFVADSLDDVKKAEAEAAVALLLDLAANARLKHVQFEFGFELEQGLWDKAIAALELLLRQDTWLKQWTNPNRKVEVLSQLLSEVQVAKKHIDEKRRRVGGP